MEKANIQYKSVNFMRGRSIQNSIVILQPRNENNLKFLLPCFLRLADNVKRIYLNSNLFALSSSPQSLKPLLLRRALHRKYTTKSSNDSILGEAA